MNTKSILMAIVANLIISNIALAASKLKLDLSKINASLSEGFGDIYINKVNVAMDPVNVRLEEIDYDLYMKKNFFIIEGNGQQVKLDLRSFKKIFEQQKFNAVNTDINISQGHYIVFDSEYFDVSLKEVKLNFFGARIACDPEVGRDITEEILGLCLKKSSIDLPKGVLTGREDVIYKWAKEFFKDQKIDHLPKFARPTITDGHASIKNGNIILRADLKVLLTMKLSGTGFIEYQGKENIISVKIKTLDSKYVSLKKPLLKLLSMIENEFFSVDGDILVFNLEEMRSNTER